MPKPPASPEPPSAAEPPGWPPPPRPSGGPVLFGVALLALLAAGAAGLVLRPPATADFTPEEIRALAGAPDPYGIDERFEAEPPRSELYLATRPGGATVWLNAEHVGVTPLRFPRLAPGAYFVSIEQAGFAPIDTFLLLDGGMAVHLDLALRATPTERQPQRAPPAPDLPAEGPPIASPKPDPAPHPPSVGALRVASRPAGAEVLVGGERRGRTPLALSDLGPGLYTVSIEHPGFERATRRVEVKVGATATVNVDLVAVPQSGRLAVTVRPWGTIFVGEDVVARGTGSEPGPTRYQASLPPGTYRIRVVHPQYGTWTRTVEVEAGQPTEVLFDLAALSADAAPVPPAGGKEGRPGSRDGSPEVHASPPGP